MVTIEDIVNMILSKINKKLTINYQEKDFPEINHQYLDSTKIKKATGWLPNTKILDGLDMSIAQYETIL